MQLYRTDDYLIECLAADIAEGIWAGEAAVVVATAEHRSALKKRLSVKSVNLGSAIRERPYVTMDAEECLGRFIKADRMNPKAFEELFGPVLENAGRDRTRTRVFGEMVAVLWMRGQRAVALELEQCWNRILRRIAFRLFCAYPAACADSKEANPPFDVICQAHSHVVSLGA